MLELERRGDLRAGLAPDGLVSMATKKIQPILAPLAANLARHRYSTGMTPMLDHMLMQDCLP